jgi:hypothetical protein
MDAKDDFLCTLYLNTRNDLENGNFIDLIQKMLRIEKDEVALLVRQLLRDGLIEQIENNEGKIKVSFNGLQKAKKLIDENHLTIIRFHSSQFVPPMDRLIYGFNFYYNINTKRSESNYHILIRVSDIVSIQLQLNWGKGQSGEKLLFQYAKDWITEKLKENSLPQYEDVVIMVADLPNLPSYKPEDLPQFAPSDYVVDLPKTEVLKKDIKNNSEIVKEVVTIENNKSEVGNNERAHQLITIRDTINSLFNNDYNEKLLLLPQERNLLDFFKDANNEEEFMFRLISLACLAREMNVKKLRELTGINDPEIRSVQLLKKFIEGKPNSEIIINVLYHLGKLRNGYPAHTDNSKNFVASYEYFQIKYPVVNYSESWNILLSQYFIGLRFLKEIIEKK